MKIAFFSVKSYDKLYFDRFNTGHEFIYFDAQLNQQTVYLAKGCEGICVFVNDRLDREVIGELNSLGIKLIVLRCAGFNNVNLQAAAECSMTVSRVPAYSPFAVAEHATALILTLNRKIHKAYNRVREGNFSLEKLIGFDLNGKTVGVIGTGKIGQIFCRIMLGFGCRVLAFDVMANKEMESLGVEYMSLVNLLPQCQILALHCPLTDQTNHIINDETLSMMAKGAMLINTSRGALIDTKAVIRALKHGHLGSLGLDVYEQEEKLFFHDHSESLIDDEIILRLLSFPNVIITSHQGFFTEEALTQIAKTTLENIEAFEKGVKKPETQLV